VDVGTSCKDHGIHTRERVVGALAPPSRVGLPVAAHSPTLTGGVFPFIPSVLFYKLDMICPI